MNILYTASEAIPFAASGGLADVAGSLPAAMNALGHDCRVVMPYYSQIRQELKDELSSIEKKLIMNYGADVVKSLNNHEVVIVAPTATRKPKLFDYPSQSRGAEKFNIEALSFIAKYCTNKKRVTSTINDSAIIPLCIMPPIGFKPGLNLKLEYEFGSIDAFRFHESSFDLRCCTPVGNNILESKYMDSLKICCEQSDRYDMIW